MNYKKFVKPDSFIDKYLRARSKSCSPIEYDFWCALVVLARAHTKSWISAYSPGERNKVPITLRVALLSDSGLTQRAECIDFVNAMSAEYPLLSRLSECAPSDYSDVGYIPVLNETRRKGSLFTPSEYTLAKLEQQSVALWLTPCAHSVFDNWHLCRRASVTKLRAAFESIEHIHVLQVAALLALNEGTDAINGTYVRNAIKLVQHVKSNAFSALEFGYARDKAALALEKLTEILRTRQLEPIKSSDLYLSVRHWIDVDTFHFCMDIMHELKFVTKYATHGTGRRLVCYKANESLLSDDVVNKVLKEVDIA